MRIRRQGARGKVKAKPTVDAVRKRNVELVQLECSRLLQSVDEAKRYAPIESLDVVARILGCAYTLIDSRKSDPV